MTPRLELGDLLNILYENAINDFCKTKQYEFLQEKRAIVNNECKDRFTPDDFDFVCECFETLLNCEYEEMEFVYHRGYKDCISILKMLEVV